MTGNIFLTALFFIPNLAYHMFSAFSSAQRFPPAREAFTISMDTLATAPFRERLWVAEGIVATLAIPLAFISWRRHPRPEEASTHRAWFRRIMQDARREIRVQFMLMTLGLTAGAIACLYWVSLISGDLFQDTGETAAATLLTLLSILLLFLPSVVETSESGTLSGYARDLAAFTLLATWCSQKHPGPLVASDDELDRRKRRALKKLAFRYIIVGPAMLMLWMCFSDAQTRRALWLMLIVAVVLGITGLVIGEPITNLIPNVIMRRSGGSFIVGYSLLMLGIVVGTAFGTVTTTTLTNIDHALSWGDLLKALAGWALCLYWLPPLFAYCLGRTSRPHGRLSRWLGLDSLEHLTDVALIRAGRSTLQTLRTYETSSPIPKASSHDLAAIADLIVPPKAVLVDPQDSTGADFKSTVGRSRAKRRRDWYSNAWLIDPNLLIADGREVEGKSLREALRAMAAELMIKKTAQKPAAHNPQAAAHNPQAAAHNPQAVADEAPRYSSQRS